MAEMTVYKVVYRHTKDRTLRSPWSTGLSQVIYRPSEWTKAPDWLAEKGYHLLAFDSREEACSWPKFMRYMDRVEVWEAVGESEILPLPLYLYMPNLKQGLIDHWESGTWPARTRMFRKIKLVRRIQQGDQDVQTP